MSTFVDNRTQPLMSTSVDISTKRVKLKYGLFSSVISCHDRLVQNYDFINVYVFSGGLGFPLMPPATTGSSTTSAASTTATTTTSSTGGTTAPSTTLADNPFAAFMAQMMSSQQMSAQQQVSCFIYFVLGYLLSPKDILSKHVLKPA